MYPMNHWIISPKHIEAREQRPSRKIRFWVFWTLVIRASSAFPETAPDVSINRTPLEQFKQFMASPPVIENVVFQMITAFGDSPLPEAKGAKGVHDWVNYLQARWQPDCLFLKSGTNLNVADPGKRTGEEINARFHDEHWTLSRMGFVTSWSDSAKTPDQIRSLPSRAFHHRSHQFAELMNMGVMQIPVGVVKWDGDSFNAPGYIPELKTHVEVTGHVKPDANGYAKEMSVQYRSKTGIFAYVLRYYYETNVGLSYFPNRLTSSIVRDGKETKLMECETVSIKTSPARLARSDFDPEVLIPARGVPITRYTNDTLYARNALGQWTPLRDGSPLTSFTNAREHLLNNNFYYGAEVVGTMIAFSIIWGINRTTKNNQKEKAIP